MEQNVGKLLGVRNGPAGNAAPANGAASKPAAPVKK